MHKARSIITFFFLFILCHVNSQEIHEQVKVYLSMRTELGNYFWGTGELRRFKKNMDRVEANIIIQNENITDTVKMPKNETSWHGPNYIKSLQRVSYNVFIKEVHYIVKAKYESISFYERDVTNLDSIYREQYKDEGLVFVKITFSGGKKQYYLIDTDIKIKTSDKCWEILNILSRYPECYDNVSIDLKSENLYISYIPDKNRAFETPPNSYGNTQNTEKKENPNPPYKEFFEDLTSNYPTGYQIDFTNMEIIYATK